MSGELNGRVAMVTGGGAGIGAAISRKYVEAGADVVVVDRGSGAETAANLGAQHMIVDVADQQQIERAVDAVAHEHGRLDILVNNAWSGIQVGRLEFKTDEQMQIGLGVGFYGPFWAMRAAHPHMSRQGWGRIINMGSLNGVNAHMGTAEYNSAKEALRSLTRTAAREWGRSGITVNTLCPAAKSRAFNRTVGLHPEIGATADASNPMGRIGDPYDDIAPVALFLASEGSRYLTGNTLFVDGGAHINGVAWTPNLDG